jgi:hypothetical protein
MSGASSASKFSNSRVNCLSIECSCHAHAAFARVHDCSVCDCALFLPCERNIDNDNVPAMSKAAAHGSEPLSPESPSWLQPRCNRLRTGRLPGQAERSGCRWLAAIRRSCPLVRHRTSDHNFNTAPPAGPAPPQAPQALRRAAGRRHNPITAMPDIYLIHQPNGPSSKEAAGGNPSTAWPYEHELMSTAWPQAPRRGTAAPSVQVTRSQHLHPTRWVPASKANASTPQRDRNRSDTRRCMRRTPSGPIRLRIIPFPAGARHPPKAS